MQLDECSDCCCALVKKGMKIVSLHADWSIKHGRIDGMTWVIVRSLSGKRG
jgi:hypothetical protein